MSKANKSKKFICSLMISLLMPLVLALSAMPFPQTAASELSIKNKNYKKSVRFSLPCGFFLQILKQVCKKIYCAANYMH